MKLIYKYDPKHGMHCLPCGVLFSRDEEDQAIRHVEQDHKIPYIPDAFGDVYDIREVVTPGDAREAAAI